MPGATTGRGGERINLVVKGQDGQQVFFRVKRSSRLKKLMDSYSDNKFPDGSRPFVFLFDETRIRADQTPEELDLEDGDMIDAMLPQTGGG